MNPAPPSTNSLIKPCRNSWWVLEPSFRVHRALSDSCLISFLPIQNECFKDCTVVAVAHKISTVLGFDRILVISAGEVIEDGSPAELLSNPTSCFRTLASDQNLIWALGRKGSDSRFSQSQLLSRPPRLSSWIPKEICSYSASRVSFLCSLFPLFFCLRRTSQYPKSCFKKQTSLRTQSRFYSLQPCRTFRSQQISECNVWKVVFLRVYKIFTSHLRTQLQLLH